MIDPRTKAQEAKSNPKFHIGEVAFWVESSCLWQKKVHCSMCFGKLKVQIILGNDEIISSECGACSSGINGPSGFETIWEAAALVNSRNIDGVIQTHGEWKYRINNQEYFGSDLYKSAEEAEPIRLAKLAEEKQRSDSWYKDHFHELKKSQIWNAKYHRTKIEDYERSIEWHRMRLGMIKDKTPPSEEGKSE